MKNVLRIANFVSFLVLIALASPVGAATTTRIDISALCARVKPAYIFISGGSGVVIRPDGLMLTNAHVIENKKQFDVRNGEGRHYVARLLGRDSIGDLAVLKLELKPGEQAAFLELGDSDALRVGDPALAVGNPFGLGVVDQSPTYTLGVISALHYLQGRYAECVVTDAEVNPGNSGGPLVNLAGQVVGINGQISTRWGLRSNTGLGFAISTRQIRMWLPRLEAAQGEEVKHGRISGMELQEAAGDTPQSVIVKDVGEGTPAGVGGFQKGDAIVRIDGLPAPNAFRLASLIGIYPDGHEATFEVRRDGKELPLKVQLVAARRAQLGVTLTEPQKDDKHVKVATVAQDSAAEKAGLKVGDEILGIDGAELTIAVGDQYRLLNGWMKNAIHSGDIIYLKVQRKTEKEDAAEVTLRIVVR